MPLKQQRSRWNRFSRKAFIGLGIAFIAVFTPCPVWTPDVFTYWQVPVGMFFLIVYMGVVLFDTFFFDRYH